MTRAQAEVPTWWTKSNWQMQFEEYHEFDGRYIGYSDIQDVKRSVSFTLYQNGSATGIAKEEWYCAGLNTNCVFTSPQPVTPAHGSSVYPFSGVINYTRMSIQVPSEHFLREIKLQNGITAGESKTFTVNDAYPVYGNGVHKDYWKASITGPVSFQIPKVQVLDPNPQLIDSTGKLINDPSSAVSITKTANGTQIDGVSKLLLVARSDADLQFSLDNESDGTLATLDDASFGVKGDITTNEISPVKVPSGESFVTAVYTPPDYSHPAKTDKRTVNIKVSSPGNLFPSLRGNITVPIQLYPPCSEKINPTNTVYEKHEFKESDHKYKQGPWEADIGFSEPGLTLSNITFKGQPFFEEVSVPHFKIDYGTPPPKSGIGSKYKTIEFVAFTDVHAHEKGNELDRIWLLEQDQAKGMDTIHWFFEKKFHETDLKGSLCINYDIVFRWKPTNNCELSHTDCYRFIPKVSFRWFDSNGMPAPLSRFTAYYKLDYGQTGLTLTSDTNNVADIPATFNSLFRQSVLTKEILFNAVQNGKEGEYDNIHSVHSGENVVIPGCRTTGSICIHQHWRWSGMGKADIAKLSFKTLSPNVDPMVEPSNDAIINANLRGTPYLVPGQTITIAIVKDNPAEFDATDPFSLVNGETIATLGQNVYTPATVEHVVVWYIASVNHEDHDTFQRHGVFTLVAPAVG